MSGLVCRPFLLGLVDYLLWLGLLGRLFGGLFVVGVNNVPLSMDMFPPLVTEVVVFLFPFPSTSPTHLVLLLVDIYGCLVVIVTLI